MKLLHIALITDQSPQLGLRTALKRYADEYIEYSWIPKYNAGRIAELRQEVIELVRTYRPTHIFCQLQTPNIISPDDFREIKRINPCYIINWTGDVRQPTPHWYIDTAPAVDITLFTNQADVDKLKSLGLRADYLQIGYSPTVFNPDGGKDHSCPDIVFMGSNYNRRFPLSEQRSEMVAGLKRRYGSNFMIFGHNWGGEVQFLAEPSEARIYRSCRIAINQNHFILPRFSSDRIFRIIGSGAFCASQYYPGIELEWEPGKHLVTWTTFEELYSLIDHYLSHDGERRLIASQGNYHCVTNHTWECRVKDLFGRIVRI